MILETLRKYLLSWDGVSEHEHRFGGVEFRYQNKELGHLHGEQLADLPFPKSVRDELIETKQAEPHHVLPNSGWVSFRMKGEEDIPHLLKLFKMQYDRLSAKR
ncbi:luciferase domain-containing protein [Risungbinella massiliensis]|uniref:luciferase domain-containing protein n=1 Tax=Risungbinella massiliensis TaxID=1329796 RepID=UPI0005CC2B20|nr:luciferase family protein [Risungbinella massiliensis]